MNVTNFLELTNTVLEAAVVILISSVLLYGIQSSIRNRVARASSFLLSFTVIAYLGDLLLSQTDSPLEIERWLRAQWVGIAFVPSAYTQLSVALLEFSGTINHKFRKRLFVGLGYILSAATLTLVMTTDLIVKGRVINVNAPQLSPGRLFPIFAITFGGFIIYGFSQQLLARRQSRTATMKRRITYLIASACGPVVSVFPYLVITGQSDLVPAPLFWALQVLGNGLVTVTVAFMTYSISYFGVREPDRVIRLRLIKFLARGPLVAFGVLVLLIIVGRAGSFFGLSIERATPFVIVSGIVILQWIILMIKPALERWFYFDEREEVIRIQELRDRVLTTQDMHQYLENVLASICQVLQSDTAFLASMSSDGTPRLEILVGELALMNGEITEDSLKSLRLDPSPDQGQLDRFSWNGYWIVPLTDRGQENILGILGVLTPVDLDEWTEEKNDRYMMLAGQAAAALEDQLLQQEVFSAMEGLLQRVRIVQKKKQALALDGKAAIDSDALIKQKEFTGMVRDALNHYWGGPKLMNSPLMKLEIVRQGIVRHNGSAINAIRDVLLQAMESLRPAGERSMTTTEWILYNILELKFMRGLKVRDVARRLAMSESDLYRKQRFAIEAVAQRIAEMEVAVKQDKVHSQNREKSGDDKESVPAEKSGKS